MGPQRRRPRRLLTEGGGLSVKHRLSNKFLKFLKSNKLKKKPHTSACAEKRVAGDGMQMTRDITVT